MKATIHYHLYFKPPGLPSNKKSKPVALNQTRYMTRDDWVYYLQSSDYQLCQEASMKNNTRTSSLLLVLIVALLNISSLAQSSNSFRARLSPMPVTPQTVNSITGEGEVLLTLNGNTLSIQGSFAGMSSVATMAHIHNGPPAQPGPVVHKLEVDSVAAGNINGELELTDQQVEALHNDALYIQIHTENNPAGELRGWIFATN
jgi:hypothetical protein